MCERTCGVIRLCGFTTWAPRRLGWWLCKMESLRLQGCKAAFFAILVSYSECWMLFFDDLVKMEARRAYYVEVYYTRVVQRSIVPSKLTDWWKKEAVMMDSKLNVWFWDFCDAYSLLLLLIHWLQEQLSWNILQYAGSPGIVFTRLGCTYFSHPASVCSLEIL